MSSRSWIDNGQSNPDEAPYYLAVGNEVEIFEAAFHQKLPLLLKGPTGCGKTRFVEHMAWRLMQGSPTTDSNLITISCHEDLSASDLVGRFLLNHDSTYWQDGPLTRAVRDGAICYLDEVVEARKDTTVLIHSLTDHRRTLPIDKTGELVEAADGFLLVISYNPGYQSILKDLKTSTRQRFVSLEFDYPSEPHEAEIIRTESQGSPGEAEKLARLGKKVRNLKQYGFSEGVSTRLLIYASTLMRDGIEPALAVESAITCAVSDDDEVQAAIRDIANLFWS